MIKEASKKGFLALQNNYLPAIITALFILTSLFADAQVYQRDLAYGRDIDRQKVRKVQLIPTFCGTPTLISTDSTAAAIAFDSCNHRFYFFDPKTKVWDTTGGGGGGVPPTRIWLDSVRRAVGTDSIYEYYSSQAVDGRRFAFLAPETGSTPTLEEVTTAGHHTSVGIQFTSEAVGFPGIGVELSAAYNDALRINNTSNNPLDLNTSNLTDPRTQNFPDKDGTFAMLSDIGTTLDSTIVATDGQEDFTFTDLPVDYKDIILFRNGMELEPITHYTKSGNTITIIIPMDADDRIRVKRIK